MGIGGNIQLQNKIILTIKGGVFIERLKTITIIVLILIIIASSAIIADKSEKCDELTKKLYSTKEKLEHNNVQYENTLSDLKHKHSQELTEMESRYKEELQYYKRNYNTTSRSVPVTDRTTNNTYLGIFTSTAYCIENYHHICNNGNPSATANGSRAIPYQTVAVDPKIIPLGSKLKIEVDGQVYYVTANDTGGAIKGNKIDMVCPTHSEALQWGRKQVEVYLLN